MPTIEVYDDSGLPEHLGWQLVTFDRCQWPEEVDESFPWGPRAYAPYRKSRYVVAVEGRALLGAAAVIDERATIAAGEVSVAGLGTVFTFPSRRGQGLGGRLVRQATALIDESGSDTGGLFCIPENEAFYAKYGWVRAPGGTYLQGDTTPYRYGRMMRLLSDNAVRLGDHLLSQPITVHRPW